MPQSVEQRIKKLREEINHHNYLYYSESRPQISDREFDRLLAELIELEKANPHLITPDSPSQRVGGDVQDELRPVRHAVPMMSIDNTYSEEEVRAFDERVRKGLGMEKKAGGGLFGGGGSKVYYIIEPKIDGASVTLRYEKGQLV